MKCIYCDDSGYAIAGTGDPDHPLMAIPCGFCGKKPEKGAKEARLGLGELNLRPKKPKRVEKKVKGRAICSRVKDSPLGWVMHSVDSSKSAADKKVADASYNMQCCGVEFKHFPCEVIIRLPGEDA